MMTDDNFALKIKLVWPLLITNDLKANLSVMVNDVEFRSQKLEFTTDLKIKLAGEIMCLDIFLTRKKNRMTMIVTLAFPPPMILEFFP